MKFGKKIIKRGAAMLMAAVLTLGTVSTYADETEEQASVNTAEETEITSEETCVESEADITDTETQEQEIPEYYTLHSDEWNVDGTVLINGTEQDVQAQAGETVILQGIPDKGFELSYFYGVDENYEMVEFVQDGENFLLTMPESDITVEAIFVKSETTEEAEKTEQEEAEETEPEETDDVETDQADAEEEQLELEEPVYYTAIESSVNGINLLSNKSISFKMQCFLSYELVGWKGDGTGSDAMFYMGADSGNPNGMGFCLNPTVQAPGRDQMGTTVTYYTDVTSYTDTQLVKILYYGVLGDGDKTASYFGSTGDSMKDLTKYHIATHIAAVRRATELGIPGASSPYYGANAACQAAANGFYNYVKSLPDVSGTVYVLTPVSGQQTICYLVADKTGYLKLSKSSSIPSITSGNSCYSLKGAEYTVYSDSACTKAAATLTTDSNGNTGTVELDAGTYYVKETKAPKGYLTDTKKYTVTVTANNTASNPAKVSVKDTPGNDPIGILLQKLDAETGKATTKLAGAQYTVKYYDVASESAIAGTTPEKTWVLKTDSNGRIFLNNAHKVSGDDLYIDSSSGAAVLPLGYITIQETKAPDGYLPDETVYTCRTDLSGGTVRTTNLPVDEEAVNESPKRGDLDFTKVSERTGKPLYGVPFEIKNNDTGETHTIVTDEKGYASTQSSHNLHSKNTNKGTSSHDGIWFGELSALDDSKGALPYGEYTITEQPCDANYGMDLVTFTVSVTENNVTVHAGDVTNLTIGIATTAFSTKTGIKTIPVNSKEEITDVVSYTNLTVGREYTLKATVVDKATEATVATGEKTFKPETTAGTVNVPITIDTSKVAGKTLVVLEELYQGDSRRQDHTSLADDEQTVYVPEIGTTAEDTATGDHVGTVGEKTTLVDTVEFKGLQAGKTYTVSGRLMDKKTGEAVLVNGEEVTAESSFTPSTTSGTVDITFVFDTSSIAGKSVVAFETVSYEDIELCVHTDINDTDQTVDYPSIKTSAVDSQTGDEQAVAGEEVTLVDTVSYENLEIGKEYTVKGILMDQETGEKFLVNGETVTSEKTFTAESVKGTVDMEFTFNSLAVEGKTTVVFEELYHNGVKVTSHADITDNGQTVHIPKGGTKAVDGDTEDEVGTESETATVKDTVYYENLISGKEYTVSGVLMNKDTNEPLLVNDEQVTAETTFTPDEADGEVELVYELDASALRGVTVVVFENFYHNGVEIYSHADINDEDQSIHYPEVHTAAIDGDTLDRVGTVHETATIVDTVYYNNLVVGKEYTIKGKLMDQITGEPLLVNDEEITSEITFTAETSEGNINLAFQLDSSELKGTSTVVFEDLYHNDILVTSHSDIEDEDQTVEYPEIHTSAKDSQTGDDQGVAAETVTIVDTVTYSNLIVGKEYTVKGTLMDKETGEALLVDGKEVTAENTFTAEEKDGTVKMEFTFDSLAVKGKTTVVFEELYHNDVLVTVHADIEDKDQDVVIPEMHTTAKDADTDTHVGSSKKKAKIIDTVIYSNLIVGNEYTVSGVLMSKKTNEPLLVDGKEITAETTFTAEKSSGEVELVYELNASALQGTTIVVFENLNYEGIEVYSHADINDEDQSVHYPDMKTTATSDGAKEVTVSTNTTITDVVAYSNLIVGETYTVKGVLMDKATGKTLISGGKEVTAEATFKAQKTEGEVTMNFTFDASALGGHDAVVFEEMYHKGILVAVHKDLTDEGQTVKLNTAPTTTPPNTGDATKTLPFVVMLLAAVVIAGIVIARNRKKTKENI